MTKSMHQPIGTTQALAETAADAKLLRAVRKAEEKSGFKTGVRFSQTGQHIVSVTFYPKTKFYIQDMAPDTSLEPARELTTEEFGLTWSLRL
jgi:hypothetical protein